MGGKAQSGALPSGGVYPCFSLDSEITAFGRDSEFNTPEGEDYEETQLNLC